MGKHLKIKIDGDTWRATGATLHLTDEGADFNHPAIAVSFVREGSDYDDQRHLRFQFQRSNMSSSLCSPTEERATGMLDTARPWGIAYAGHLEVDARVEIVDRPFALDARAQLGVALARRIARFIRERNLHHVHRCEAARAFAALGGMGVIATWEYHWDRRGAYRTDRATVTSVHEARDLGVELRCNQRAKDAERERDRQADIERAGAAS